METKVGTNSCISIEKIKSNKRQKFCIIIPVYKDHLEYTEKLSLRKLHEVSKRKYNVYLVCPNKLDNTEYIEIFPELKEKRFDDKYFENTASYSKLCLSYELYKAFEKYEYLLIYQLDCLLIYDNIEEWCNKGYDYIGAPIVATNAFWPVLTKDSLGRDVYKPMVGNGGFCLRKIDTFMDILDPNGYLNKRYNILNIISNVNVEDLFICTELTKIYDISLPQYTEAVEFAIDMNPDVIKPKNLPMGIHAFHKNFPYWKDKIDYLSNDQEAFDSAYRQCKDFIDIYYYKKEIKKNEES